MDTKEELKNGITELISESEKLLIILTRKVSGTAEILEFSRLYQPWYTKTLKVFQYLAKDRLDEFISYYQADPRRKEVNVLNYVIQDYINGRGASQDYKGKPLWEIENSVFIKLINQIDILKSLDSRIDSVFSDIQGIVLSQLLDKELAVADKLMSVHPRAAGALAGVVLESHLQKVASNHEVKTTKKDPTISDLNELLKSNGILDVPTWRKVQYLGDIRNLCSHKKSEDPSIAQVSALISGANEIIKTVF